MDLVINDHSGLWSPSDIHVIRDFVNFVCNYFLDIRIVRNLNIELTFHREKKDANKNTTIAMCGPIVAENRPRDFEIDIYKKMSLTKTLMILGHELTHLKQFAQGKLVSRIKNGKHIAVWNKKAYTVDLKGKRATRNYWLHPWEIEARGMEYGLLIVYLNEKFGKDPDWFENPWM